MPQANKPATKTKSTSTRANAVGSNRKTPTSKKSVRNGAAARPQSVVGQQAYHDTVEHGQSAIMMIDRDFVITYVNQKTRRMLVEYAPIFKSLWPTLDADKIVGTCIDMFHKNPQHQRQMLSDPSRLPYKTDIRIADLAFSLQVTAQYNSAGEYVGNTLEWSDVTSLRRLEGVSLALDQSQAVIEFTLDGTVITANKNFLNTLGYTLAEIQGKPHSLFVDPHYAASPEYRQFWQDLNAGKYQAGEFCRVGKGGKQVWIQASYNPIVDQSGKPFRVIKYASDITAAKMRNADFEGQLQAINLSQAVIEFTMDGVIVQANDNFLNTVGYTASEVQGKHHSMFVDPEYARSNDYRLFWDDLKQGRFRTDQFLRYGKGGRAIWIQASYNPILDMNGKPIKVVKYATDITAQKDMERAIAQKQKEDADLAEAQQRKVQVVLGVVNAMADGNFSIEVPDLGADAVGQVSQSLRQAVGSMRQALTEVRNVSATVATSAEQLSSASREISSGAQEQASSLEETASSLEEITSTVKQNTDNAQQARQLATGSRDVAEKGGQVVGNAVEAMGAINQASKKIADIITTIDEIAFQTNLLALNAAVEAARAGEQGRGFAVVAAEVRNLAQRSASAAKEIKTLIQDSLRKVENGTELVNKSGETLGEIVSSVKRVTDIVAEIAAASKEQLTGIEQVNKAVAQMDRVTQSNASQTEEVAGTAGSLLQHAERLRDLVAHFQLGDEQRGAIHTQPSKPVTPASASRNNLRATANSVGNTLDVATPSGAFEF